MRGSTMVINLALFASVASAAPGSSDASPMLPTRDFHSQEADSPLLATSSRPAPGTYRISNRVPGPNNEKLAITFNGYGKRPIVTPASGSLSQKWVIADRSKGQTVQPAHDKDIDVIWGSTGSPEVGPVEELTDVDFTWLISQTDNGYTIQDIENMGGFWQIDKLAVTSALKIDAKSDQAWWILEKDEILLTNF